MLPTGKPGLFTWNTTVLSEVSEPTMQWKLMIIGMTAEYAGPLLSRMLVRKLMEKPDKKPNRYQITQKGKEFLATPPEEVAEKHPTPPVTPLVTPSAEVGDGDEGRDEGRRDGKRQGKQLKKLLKKFLKLKRRRVA
jgi:hypothetical protein